ncbi:prepilin-type N-terminal cleavage/methylation domain-containing protein [Natronospora cellulosivora (SeqCode)]
MKEDGFTLLEILIAITITGIIIGAVFVFLHQGLRLWESFGIDEEYNQYMRIMDRSLKDDLKFIYYSQYNEKELFTGNYSGFEFYVLKGDLLKKISYQTDYRENAIVKTSEIISKYNEPEERLIFILGEDISRIDYSFYNGRDNYWEYNWSFNEKGYLPDLIRIQVYQQEGAYIEEEEILLEIYTGRIFE